MSENVDDTISATVRALAAARSIRLHDVAALAGMTTSTFDRRLARGGWTASEAATLADAFAVTVDALMTGIDGTLTGDSV